MQNFPLYIRNRTTESSLELLEEMHKIQYLKPKVRPPFSSTLLRLALMTRYTSKQAYNILLEELPLPSLSLMQKLTHGGIEPIKALKVLLEEQRIDDNIVLLVDEMYLEKSCEYHSGQYIGKDDDGEFYNGIMVFMVVGLRKSIPFVIKSCPKTKINGGWLCDELSESVTTLHATGFSVRAIISDNHSVNVNAFSTLKKKFSPNKVVSDLFITHSTKIYLMFDSVHLIKNIRNNLLNVKRFIFPAFSYDGFSTAISVTPGEISWGLLHSVYDQDEKLQGNLRKANKLTYASLHPGNNKQKCNWQ